MTTVYGFQDGGYFWLFDDPQERELIGTVRYADITDYDTMTASRLRKELVALLRQFDIDYVPI